MQRRRSGAGAAAATWLDLSSGAPGSGSKKQPQDEAQQRQHDDQHRPQNLPAGIRGTLKYVYDRPDIRDQKQKAKQTVAVIHASSLVHALPAASSSCTSCEAPILNTAG